MFDFGGGFEYHFEGLEGFANVFHGFFSFLGVFLVQVPLIRRPQHVDSVIIVIIVIVIIIIIVIVVTHRNRSIPRTVFYRNDHGGIQNPVVVLGTAAGRSNRRVRKDFSDAADGRAHFLRPAVAEAAICDGEFWRLLRLKLFRSLGFRRGYCC